MLSVDEAVLQLRADPQMAALVHDTYLDRDVFAAAERFLQSAEFTEVKRLLNGRWENGIVVDLGAGIGIAAYAFARSEAKRVLAVEPDPSDEVGQGAILRLPRYLPITVVGAYGQALPLPEASVDLIYVRQVLHHIPDLPAAMRECARVLKPNGILLACREHVVDDNVQKQIFLQNHVMHRLAGNENAYTLAEYLGAFRHAGLTVQRIFQPWDTVINAYPEVRSTQELSTIHQVWLKSKFGAAGSIFSAAPGMNRLVRMRFNNLRKPGRMYTFLVTKSV